MTDVDQIAEGRAAWQRIRAQERLSWDDWIAVGKALLIGRTHCMKIAQVNKIRTGRYNYVANAWLEENGFTGICAQERYRICRIIENLDEVTRWRDSLPPEKQRRINHPSHWASFCAFKRGKPRRPDKRSRPVERPSASGRQIHWPQETIRRCAMAMKDSRSGDWYQLARIGLEAAIASDVELIALLNPTKSAKPSRRTADAPTLEAIA